MTVLITDANANHALAAARSLGTRGVAVVMADSRRLAKGFFSRFCSRRVLYPSPSEGIRAFRHGLFAVLDRLRPTLLMPMTERTILALTDDREELESRVSLLPLPAQEAIEVAFDKLATVRLAESLGVLVPRTFAPASLADLQALRDRIPYPAVIKPRRSEIRTRDDRLVPGGPADYCLRAEDLEPKYLAVHRRAPLPLIQEFVPGDGYGVSVLYSRGQVRALFAHRRLRMVRPTGSGSSLRESIAPPPAMVEATRRLLDALKWHGVAMVEFKLDARDGTAKLMEINGRFWNSLPLAVAAGVDFPYLLYRLGTEGDVPDCFEYRLGVQCRWLVGDLRHLFEVLRGRPRDWPGAFPSRRQTLRAFLRFAARDLHYDVLSLSDPLPAVADVADLLFHQIPSSYRRRRMPAVEEKSDA